jgi:VWFA-related protein
VKTLCWFWVSFLVAASISATTQRRTFRSGTEAIRVDVLVSERGRPVQGLREGDFELRDNGVLQQIALVDPSGAPLHVVMMLDVSDSLAGEPIAYLRAAARMLVTRISKEDRVSLVTFNNQVTVHFKNSPIERLTIDSQLQSIQPAGPTALIDGVAAGFALADPALGRSLGVVFSDGVDTASWLEDVSVLEAAKRIDAVVYAVSGVRGRDNAFLNLLTSTTGGRLFEIASLKRLSDAFVAVIQEFRTRYVLMYTPTFPAAGWHNLDVKVKGRSSAVVKARSGYFVAY